jgi:hypothetical protein
LQLQVGKKYKNRRGEVIEIVAYDPDAMWCFRGQHGEGYLKNGVYLDKYTPDPEDLIEEVQEESQVNAQTSVSELQQQINNVVNSTNEAVDALKLRQDVLWDKLDVINNRLRKLEPEEPKPLRLEAGKWYETKSGRVLYIEDYNSYALDPRPAKAVGRPGGSIVAWYPLSGRKSPHGPHPMDIVREIPAPVRKKRQLWWS